MNQPGGSDPRELYHLLLRWEVQKAHRIAQRIVRRIDHLLRRHRTPATGLSHLIEAIPAATEDDRAENRRRASASSKARFSQHPSREELP
jgi:hypothetical protein